jgi:hypothetical protein
VPAYIVCLSCQRQRCHNFFVLISRLKFSGKKFNLALSLIEIDPDPQSWAQCPLSIKKSVVRCSTDQLLRYTLDHQRTTFNIFTPKLYMKRQLLGFLHTK